MAGAVSWPNWTGWTRLLIQSASEESISTRTCGATLIKASTCSYRSTSTGSSQPLHGEMLREMKRNVQRCREIYKGMHSSQILVSTAFKRHSLHLNLLASTFSPQLHTDPYPECDIPVPGIPVPGNSSIFLMVSEPVSKKFGTEKSLGTGLEKNWYRKKSRNRSRKN